MNPNLKLAVVLALTACGGMPMGPDGGGSGDAGSDGGLDDAGIDEAGDGGILLAVAGDGLFRSVNDGQTWNATIIGIANNVSSLGGSPTKFFAGEAFNGIRSSDDGRVWSGPVPPFIQVQCYGANSSTAFAGTFRGGLWKSTDDGASWQLSDGGVPFDEDVISIHTHGSKVLVGSYINGVFVSDDFGATFTQSTGLPTPEPSVYGLTHDGNTYYLSGFDVYASTTGGASWTKAANAGLPAREGIKVMLPIGGGRILGGSFVGGMYLTTDGAQSWTPVDGFPQDGGVSSLHLAHGRIWAATPTGLYWSLDAGSWTHSQVGRITNGAVGAFFARE